MLHLQINTNFCKVLLKLLFPPKIMVDLLMYLSFVIAYFATQPLVLLSQSVNPTSHITIVGVVYCDTCYQNTFSGHSYFLPGAEVNVRCKFKANSPKITEQIMISVNRTTNRYGVYKLDIPSVESVDCVENQNIQSFCRTTLIKSTNPQCNSPSMATTTNKITVKSKQSSLCIYSLSALSFKPFKKNTTLCGNQTLNLNSLNLSLNLNLNLNLTSNLNNTHNALNSSKFFLPYFPPYVFPWPQFPPLPNIPFPPCPPFPDFPFPPSPPGFSWGDPRTWIPNIPLLSPPPPPPVYNWGDPKSWIPNIPFFSPPPPPPVFNWGDPKSWIPNIPLTSSPPPSPTFDLRYPRTWIPYLPPIPPTIPEKSQP